MLIHKYTYVHTYMSTYNRFSQSTYVCLYIYIQASQWLSGKESTCQCRRPRFDSWGGKTIWRRKWQSTPVFLPVKSHGQRSLMAKSMGLQKNRTQLSSNNNIYIHRDTIFLSVILKKMIDQQSLLWQQKI